MTNIIFNILSNYYCACVNFAHLDMNLLGGLYWTGVFIIVLQDPWGIMLNMIPKVLLQGFMLELFKVSWTETAKFELARMPYLSIDSG